MDKNTHQLGVLGVKVYVLGVYMPDNSQIDLKRCFFRDQMNFYKSFC